jgi:cytoskeletal protein RodZ
MVSSASKKQGTTTMLRTLGLLGLLALPLMLLATPASAITTDEKMETCKVGAQSQNLDDAKAAAFVKKCMAKGNYEPAARRDAKKKPVAKKKPTAPAPKPQ